MISAFSQSLILKYKRTGFNDEWTQLLLIMQ